MQWIFLQPAVQQMQGREEAKCCQLSGCAPQSVDFNNINKAYAWYRDVIPLCYLLIFHSYPLITSVLSLASDLNKLRVQILVRFVTLRNNFVFCTNSKNNVIVGIVFQLSFGQAKTANKVLVITIVTLPSILFSFSYMKQLSFTEDISV